MTYVNYGSVTAIGIIFPVLAIFSLFLRFYVGRRYFRTIHVDDVLVIPAAICVIGAGIAMAVGAQNEIIGAHSPAQNSEQYFQSEENKQVWIEKFEYGFWITHVCSIGFTKLAILFFFRRLFRGSTKTTAFDISNWTLIVFVTCWMVTFLFCEIFACAPDFHAGWGTIYELHHYCVNTFAMNVANAVLNWVMDLAILVEPLAKISTLHMRTAQKLQTSFVFLLATFAVGAGLTRMIVWIEVLQHNFSSDTSNILGVPSGDDLGVVSVLLFWTYIEMGVGFLVACLPPCRKALDSLTNNAAWRRIKSLSSLRSNRSKDTQDSSSISDKDSQIQGPSSNFSRTSEKPLDIGEFMRQPVDKAPV